LKFDELNFTACAEITVDLDEQQHQDITRAVDKSISIPSSMLDRDAALDELNPNSRVSFDESKNLEVEPVLVETFDSAESN